MIVRFQRDASGRVTGFDYGNPVVRHLAFTRLGDRAATTSATAKDAAPATSAVPASTAPKLESLAGEYEVAPGRMLTITVEGGQLFGQPANGGAKLALTHDTGTTFAVAGRPMTLTFTLGADGRATALVMRQNGNERTLPRVK
jgi:hypothetical protein